jgi:hypothetical protein
MGHPRTDAYPSFFEYIFEVIILIMFKLPSLRRQGSIPILGIVPL